MNNPPKPKLALANQSAVFLILGLALMAGFRARAQTDADRSQYVEVERSAHSRIMRRVLPGADDSGNPVLFTNSYTELGTGMSVVRNNRYVPASEVVHLTDYGAAATNCQHSVFFSANLRNGGITIALPDGRLMRGAPLFLSYFDGDNVAVIADLRDSLGELLPSLHQVLYPNTFSNLWADVEYTVKLRGLEQFVILR